MGVCTDEATAKDNGPLSRVVMEYRERFKTVIDNSKRPDFGRADFDPIAELVQTDVFERVGCFKEVGNWEEYLDILVQWMPIASWHSRFRRISELPGLVFLELEEFSQTGAESDAVFTTTVYEFNAANKLTHLDIYMSREINAGDQLLASWQDQVAVE